MLSSAALENPNDIFYKDEESKDLALLMENMEYHEPQDKDEHVQNMNNALNQNKYLLGVASKALVRSSIFCKACSGLWYAGYYKVAKQTGRDQGMFTITIPNKRLFEQGVKYKKKKGKEAANAQKIAVQAHEFFHIPIREEDLITVETLDDTAQPKVYAEPQDWPIEGVLEEYDETQHIRARIVCDFPWRIPGNSDKNEQEVTHVEGIILDLHGGAFMFGSTKKQLKYSQYYASKTGYPIVSLDYRLAPTHKFPSSINDCWQAYLWLLTNSEKYLKIKFEKIIIGGHSAGANLALGVMTL